MRNLVKLLPLVAMVACGGAFAAPAQPFAPAEVKLQATPARWLFTDQKGMSLYVFDRDVDPGTSTCIKACAEKWPPLLASVDAQAAGEWSVIKRPEGTRQWAFRDKPLYRFVRDGFPGAQFGERPENDLWHVASQAVATPGDAQVVQNAHGLFLANFEGMTLYTLSSDKVARRGAQGMAAVQSVCDRDCLAQWQPLQAPLMTAAPTAGDWSLVLRADGIKQWAYKSKPLYTYAGDFKPMDLNGDKRTVDRGVAQAALLEAPPALPDWVTFASTDGGEVLADPERKTLYSFDAEQNVNRPSGGASERGCNQYCLDFYKPVVAKPGAKPVGDWTVITNVSGAKQWAYKGLPLYIYKKDYVPGEITGTKNYRVFFPIMRWGGPMQGTGGS